MGFRDMFRKAAPRENVPVLPGARDGSMWKPWGWQEHQRELVRAAGRLGHGDLQAGAHSQDGAVMVVLQDQGPRLPVLVTLDGELVGVVPDNDASRVRRKVLSQGVLVGGSKVAAAQARLYHWEHGRWGLMVDA